MSENGTVSTKIQGPYLRAMLACICIGLGLAACMVSVSYTAAAVMSAIPEFAANSSGYMLYFTCISLAGVVTVSWWGKQAASETFGAKKVLLICSVWTAVCYAGFTFCGNKLILWYIVGVLAGLTTLGGFSTTSVVIAGQWFVAKKGLVMGIASAMSGMGGILLGFFMPSVVSNLGWKGTFWVVAAMILICGLAAWALVPGKGTPGSLDLLPLGYAGGVVQQSSDKPQELEGATRKEALGSWIFWAQVIGKLLPLIAVGYTQNLVNMFMQDGGFEYAQAARLYQFVSLGLMLTKIIQGSIQSWTKNIITTVAIVFVCGIVPVFFLPTAIAAGNFALIAILVIPLTFNNGQSNVLNPMITNITFGQRDFGGIWGVMSMFGALGSALGSPVWAKLYDMTGSYSLGWTVALVCLLAGLALDIITLSAAKKKYPWYKSMNMAKSSK